MSELPDDVHAGSRAWALRLLDECGLFRGRGAPLRAELESLVAGVELQGPRRPFFPSPWRVSDMFAGSCVALAALCALLERSHGRECHAAIDVEQATWIALAQYTIRWEIEGGGYWHENNAKFNERLAAKIAGNGSAAAPNKTANKDSSPLAASPASGDEPLVDPPANTPAVSPIFATLRAFLSEVYKTKDRHVFLFARIHEHPGPYLKAMGFDDAEVAHLIRLGITTPTSHPTTYLKHHREVLRLITERLGAQLAADVEKRVNAIGAIAVVPRTRQEFEETEQGRILTKLPRLQVDRFASVRGPRSPEEWAALISGEATDTNTGLWPETGWRFGSIPRVLPTRGVLHGIKVLDVTRIVAGPVCTLQLSQLGADVLRIASPEIVDYPAHDLNLNLGKRTVELDLKTAAGRDKMRELIKEADVIVNNLLFGSLDKLGFGLASVLEMVKDRPRGIIYVETNTFGFYGPMASLPGVEPLGQHMTGLSFEHGRYQPYTDPNYSAPTFTAVMLCDVTTGLAAAAGVLVALNRRAREGGSYLVRGSLTQSALAVMDMGTYKDEQMIRSLWDGYPRHETSLNPEPGAAPHEGAVGYHLRLSRWMCERKTRGSSWESGFWFRTLDHPEGGSVMGFWPTLKLSVHSPDNDHLRFTSRPLRYDNHVGFIIDADDPEGLEQGVGDLVKVGEKTFRCKPREECQAGIERFLERKAAVRTASKGGRL